MEKKIAKGYDGYKKINGRKRHLLVDTLGLILSVHVGPANDQDRDILDVLCSKIKGLYPRMERIFGDSGYQGRENKTLLNHGWLLSISKRPLKKKGEKGVFQVVPKRWIVERTFAWLGAFRRLSVDRETHPKTSEAFIILANISLALNKISP